MEIKQGDKVRVSKDAPRMYTNGSFDMFYMAYDSEVLEVEDDHAVIKSSVHVQPTARLIIPTKYLIKVDAEKKEPKFKVGDKVQVIQGLGKFEIATIVCYDSKDNSYQVEFVNEDAVGSLWYAESDLEPYTEPTKQTEAEEVAHIRQMEAELTDLKKLELDRMSHPEKHHTYEVTIDNVTMDWQRYAADLAKEIALKVANKFNAPHEAAEYAVQVAKAVVERLKKK